MTYADMARRIAALHLLFKECGVKRGDKIAVMGKNSFSWVVVYMATLTYGAVVVPVLHDFNVQDAQHIINHSDSVMLFINESIFDNMEFEKIPQVKAVLSLDRRAVLAEHPVTNRAAEKFLARLPEKCAKSIPTASRPPTLTIRTLMKVNLPKSTTHLALPDSRKVSC